MSKPCPDNSPPSSPAGTITSIDAAGAVLNLVGRGAEIAPRHRPYQPHGAAEQLLYSRAPEILLAGPAGTGKTRAALEKVFLCMLKYAGMRGLLVRKTRASLTQSVLVTLEEKVIPAGHRILVSPSRMYRNSYVLANQSELVVGGMDNANRIMSSEYDMVLACEATELGLEDWEKLLSRLRHGVMPYQQAIAECNPSYPDHWLNMRAAHSGMQRLVSRHEDNPLYFDLRTQQWTEQGELYMQTLGRLSGVRRRRLLEGTWAAPEGLVYETFIANLISPSSADGELLPQPVKPIRACAAIDWGWRDPAAILVAVEATDGVIYVVDEIYQSKLPTPQLMTRCAEMFKEWDVELCFADQSRPEMADLFRTFDLPCRVPRHEKVDRGIARVDSRLLTGKLKISERCKFLIAEARRYQYATEANRSAARQTNPGPDHAMDALRYLVTGMEQTSEFEEVSMIVAGPPAVEATVSCGAVATTGEPSSLGCAGRLALGSGLRAAQPTLEDIWGD